MYIHCQLSKPQMKSLRTQNYTHILSTAVVPLMVLISMHMSRLRQLLVIEITKVGSQRMYLLPLISISNLSTCLAADRAVLLIPGSLNMLTVKTLLSHRIATTLLMQDFLFTISSWHHIVESATISKSGLMEIKSMCSDFLHTMQQMVNGHF